MDDSDKVWEGCNELLEGDRAVTSARRAQLLQADFEHWERASEQAIRSRNPNRIYADFELELLLGRMSTKVLKERNSKVNYAVIARSARAVWYQSKGNGRWERCFQSSFTAKNTQCLQCAEGA